MVEIQDTPISGVKVIIANRFSDNRGYFQETYRDDEFSSLLESNQKFVQENQSQSKIGTFRGIHFQRSPYSQAKLIRVLTGAIIDYAVDLRKNSPTYLKWTSVLLTGDNNKQFFLPKWCGHAFYTLADDTVVCYKCTEYYHKESEDGIKYDDPNINLIIPSCYTENNQKCPFIISDKDNHLPYIGVGTDFGFQENTNGD